MRYQRLIADGRLRDDAQQRQILQHFDHLFEQLISFDPPHPEPYIPPPLAPKSPFRMVCFRYASRSLFLFFYIMRFVTVENTVESQVQLKRLLGKESSVDEQAQLQEVRAPRGIYLHGGVGTTSLQARRQQQRRKGGRAGG
jgi:predicted ATPase